MVDPDKNSGIPAILISSVVALALSLHLAQAYVGRLELSDRAGEYGRANFDTGSTNYPREVNDAEGYALKLARPVHRHAERDPGQLGGEHRHRGRALHDVVVQVLHPERLELLSQIGRLEQVRVRPQPPSRAGRPDARGERERAAKRHGPAHR